MLKFSGQVDGVGVSVKFDSYIPFVVETGTKTINLSAPLYWRAGNGKNSLAEVGIQEASGTLISITLTTIAPKYIQKTHEGARSDLPETTGNAKFFVDDWNLDSGFYGERFIDDFGPEICLIIGARYVSVVFENGGTPTEFVRNGQLRLWVDSDNFLCGFDVLDLSDDEMCKLRDCVELD